MGLSLIWEARRDQRSGQLPVGLAQEPAGLEGQCHFILRFKSYLDLQSAQKDGPICQNR